MHIDSSRAWPTSSLDFQVFYKQTGKLITIIISYIQTHLAGDKYRQCNPAEV